VGVLFPRRWRNDRASDTSVASSHVPLDVEGAAFTVSFSLDGPALDLALTPVRGVSVSKAASRLSPASGSRRGRREHRLV